MLSCGINRIAHIQDCDNVLDGLLASSPLLSNAWVAIRTLINHGIQEPIVGNLRHHPMYSDYDSYLPLPFPTQFHLRRTCCPVDWGISEVGKKAYIGRLVNEIEDLEVFHCEIGPLRKTPFRRTSSHSHRSWMDAQIHLSENSCVHWSLQRYKSFYVLQHRSNNLRSDNARNDTSCQVSMEICEQA
jgi:hypothetical protein